MWAVLCTRLRAAQLKGNFEVEGNLEYKVKGKVEGNLEYKIKGEGMGNLEGNLK